MIDFRTFVEVKITDGYGNTSWQEVCMQNGFLDGYCEGFDQFITPEFFIGLSCLRDGYFSQLFTRSFPVDISNKVRYKMDMLKKLGKINMYYFYLSEIQQFDWNEQIYASAITSATRFSDIAPDFIVQYIPSLEALGNPDSVRLFVVKIG